MTIRSMTFPGYQFYDPKAAPRDPRSDFNTTDDVR
jgi:hypothetical protein